MASGLGGVGAPGQESVGSLVSSDEEFKQALLNVRYWVTTDKGTLSGEIRDELLNQGTFRGYEMTPDVYAEALKIGLSKLVDPGCAAFKTQIFQTLQGFVQLPDKVGLAENKDVKKALENLQKDKVYKQALKEQESLAGRITKSVETSSSPEVVSSMRKVSFLKRVINAISDLFQAKSKAPITQSQPPTPSAPPLPKTPPPPLPRRDQAPSPPKTTAGEEKKSAS